MKAGLLELLGNLRFFKGSNYVGFQPPASIASSITFTLPGEFPAGTYMVVCDNAGVISFQTISGGHTQNTDTGTTSSTFVIDSDGTAVILKNSSGELQIRNAADNANADLVAKNLTLSGNLTVQGTTTTIESNTLAIGDNIIVLNNDVTGSPTEDAGVEIERGTSTNARILWDETNDRFALGLVGSEKPIAGWYETTFNNAGLTAGVLTVTHSLGRRYLPVTIADNNNKQIIPDEITFTSTSALSVDLTSYGTLSGTWTVAVG
ncbi:hypothetical protein [Pantanalinema sp. GBBB05]|uniref:hypothetical protein n=1 Tax=Pantanalinema sp. GBBB05 TaxID=2604139 RepID=UPI001D659642|nr:hypothetical protein [Pantanalinema sp. GBBB05]